MDHALPRRVLDAAAFGVLCYEPIRSSAEGAITDFTCVFMNAEAARLLRATADDLRGRTLSQQMALLSQTLYPAARVSAPDDYVADTVRVMEAGESSEYVVSVGEGADEYYSFVTKPDGIGVVITVTDVTEQVRSRRTLASRAEQMVIANEVGGVAIWEFDLQTERFSWSSKAFELYGIDPASFTGRFKEWSDLIDPEDRRRLKEGFRRTLAGEGDYELVHRIARPDGEQRFVRSSGRLVGSAKRGKLVGATVDLTKQTLAAQELAAAKQEAEAASEAKTRFLASMSHEIRTPMNGVLGMSQALSLTPLDERQRKMVDVVVRSGEALLALLNDILDLSQVEAGAMALDAEPFDLGELVHDVHALFSAKADQAGLRLDARVDPSVEGAFIGDALRVRQILSNLVSNAIKFTERGGVAVTVRQAGANVVLSVKDTGAGIAREHVASVFNRFVQLDGSSRRRYGGTGLGLAIVQKLAEAMGGGVELESEVGVGSEFTVTLPLARAGGDSADDADEGFEAASSGSEENALRILVVEDSVMNQMVIEAMLSAAGAELTFAENGRTGLDAYERGGFDVVLMDISMPVMDGLEATRRIRAAERASGRRTPIIAVTANVMPEQTESYMAAEMDAVVSKPIDSAELVNTINGVIGQTASPGVSSAAPAAPA